MSDFTPEKFFQDLESFMHKQIHDTEGFPPGETPTSGLNINLLTFDHGFSTRTNIQGAWSPTLLANAACAFVEAVFTILHRHHSEELSAKGISKASQRKAFYAIVSGALMAAVTGDKPDPSRGNATEPDSLKSILDVLLAAPVVDPDKKPK